MKKYFLLIAPLLCTQALAAPKLIVPTSVCTSAKSLMAKSQGCEDNNLFTQAAKSCLSKIDLETSKLGLDIKTMQRKGAKSQEGDLKLAAREYFELTRKLDYLIGLSEIARIDTFNYIEHLYRPEDEADDPEENMSVACFGDNIKALETIASRMEKKQYELEAALELTKAQLLETQNRFEGMDSMNSTTYAKEPAPAPAPKAAPSAPKGKNWNASDISGTKEEKKK